MRFQALIAEDDRDMAALLAELAREEGFDADTTNDGLIAEALPGLAPAVLSRLYAAR
mgnify:CR=1 FL=1